MLTFVGGLLLGAIIGAVVGALIYRNNVKRAEEALKDTVEELMKLKGKR